MKAVTIILSALLLTGVVSRASNYKVDGHFGSGPFKMLAMGQNDTLYALNHAGSIITFGPDGKETATIKTGKADAEAFAVTADGSIHLFANITETKKVKSGARMVSVNVPVGVEYLVYDQTGKQIKTLKLDGLKSVKAAHFVDGKLVVADLSARAVVILDPESGKELGRITKGLRLCCGIFDFCEAPGNTIAVSNLGAFKLQQYDLEGNLLMEFGQRGRELNDFQGCCNPVSAAYIPGGEILTVEKDPTRIKIFDEEGKNARQIDGVEELVKGCSFIPVAVDSKGVIYLAANSKGYIVKCVP